MISRHVSQVISAPPQVVYGFAADPANLLLWAEGLANSPLEAVEVSPRLALQCRDLLSYVARDRLQH